MHGSCQSAIDNYRLPFCGELSTIVEHRTLQLAIDNCKVTWLVSGVKGAWWKLTHQDIPARRRWIELRTRAGYRSDRAVEIAAGLGVGTLWTWVTPGKGHRDPNIRSLRLLKKLLNCSLDELDEIFTAWHEELEREARANVSASRRQAQ